MVDCLWYARPISDGPSAPRLLCQMVLPVRKSLCRFFCTYFPHRLDDIVTCLWSKIVPILADILSPNLFFSQCFANFLFLVGFVSDASVVFSLFLQPALYERFVSLYGRYIAPLYGRSMALCGRHVALCCATWLLRALLGAALSRYGAV